jgi:hypothetical protein
LFPLHFSLSAFQPSSLYRMTPLRKGMTTEDSVRLLRRYQRWRRGDSDKTFGEAGLDVTDIGVALDKLLSVVPALTRELASTRSQLAKCQVQRERFHSELRKQSPKN